MFPYRWGHKLGWTNICFALSMCFSWWRWKRMASMFLLYWSTEDCDWSTITYLMKHQIRRTRIHMQNCPMKSVSWRKKVRRMLIAEHLLHRIIEDSYYDIADCCYPERGKYWAQMIASLEKQDEEMLFPMLQKHMKSWWD